MRQEKERLLTTIDSFAGKTIAVWGDFILDEYLYGLTRRISREAPVLILSYRKKEYSLGCAGNVLLNLHALGARVLPIGVLGTNEQGKKVLRLLEQKGISLEYIIIEKTYQTPVKTRIFAGDKATRSQQILRIDQELTVPESPAVDKRIQESLVNSLEKAQALLISDYHYFAVREKTFNKLLPAFQKKKIPVTLDSRFRVLNFKGVTAATPNEPEVEEALRIRINDDTNLLKEAGRLMMRKLDSPALLVKRGSNGMVLFERRKSPYYIPISGSTEIVDATGAGDTVISVFTLALACGATFREAALLANHAGGLVVMKRGTATVSPRELKEAVAREK